MFTFTTSVKNYIQVFLYVSSLKPKVIFSPEIASGRFTNIPSDANKSNFYHLTCLLIYFSNQVHDI